MENKMIITQIAKDLKDYTAEEKEAGMRREIGLGYEGEIFYFDYAIDGYKDVCGLLRELIQHTANFDRDTSEDASIYLKGVFSIAIKYLGENGIDNIKNKIKNNKITFELDTLSNYKNKFKTVNKQEITNDKNIISIQAQSEKKEENDDVVQKESLDEGQYFIIHLNNNAHPVPTYRGYGSDPIDNSMFRDVIQIERQVKVKKGFFEKIETQYSFREVMIIAEKINGEMYDVITGEKIEKHSLNPGEYRCSEVDGLSYSKSHVLTKKEVVDQLSRYKPDDIERYKQFMEDTKRDSIKWYKVKYPEEALKKERERHEKEIEDNFDDFMNKFRQRNRDVY